MATLVATPGAANANSFLTLSEAQAYFETRFPEVSWSEDEASLIHSTRVMNTVLWTGLATDSVQALTWPRVGMLTRNGHGIPSNVIPQDLKDATAELTYWLERSDRFKESRAQAEGLQRLKAGKVELWFQEFDKWAASGFASGLIPSKILELLVPSWLQTNAAVDTPIFAVL